ncbi:MAG: hypothetical protein IIZ06_05230 [Kiritimatiellae bacterium]|nr:hypothetical protein [Kiritimatiellia bacterium]
MTYTDAQIEIALLASVERQAQRTASALARCHRLMQKVRDARDAGKASHAQKRRHAR